jgi:hypothetical protein
MKNTIAIARSLLMFIAVLIGVTILTSCANDKASLAASASRALIVAEAFGAVKPAEAAAIRKGGKLLLDLDTAGTQDAKLAVLSDAVVDFAEERGAISDTEADAMRQANVVELGTSPPSPPASTTATK